MLVLSETTDNIQVVLGSAVTTNQLQCKSSWRDITTTVFTPGRTVTNTNDTTDVNVVPSPGASTQRVCDLINIYNADTVARVVTVKLDANGTEYILWKGTLLVGSTLTYIEGLGWGTSAGDNGYVINVQALTSSPADSVTTYFGVLPKAPVSVGATSKVYIPKAGKIKHVEIYCYSGTAGTAEGWSLYVRVNDATDYLISTVSTSASERRFTNAALDIPVVAGDYIEIKSVQPLWTTNPLTTIFGGYIYIE